MSVSLALGAAGLFGQSYSITPLVPFLDMQSRASGLNDGGVVIGTYQQASGNWHAFLFNGQFTDLGTLGGRNSESLSVNMAGEVVGDSDVQDGNNRHAFLYRSGQLYDLNLLVAPLSGWLLTTARSVNDAGQITGLGTYNGRHEPFVLSPAAMDLCNSHEQPACFTIAPWKSNTAIDASSSSSLIASGNSEAVALSANAQGQMVGTKPVAWTGESRAVLFRNGLTADLNSLIRGDSGWTLQDAVAINDSGQVVGSGLFQSRVQAYLLTPLQPSSRLANTRTATSQTADFHALSAATTSSPSTVAALAADSGAPSGPAGGALTGTYPDPLLAGITAGMVVFGSGDGKLGQDSSLTFNPAVKELSLSNGANVHNSATLNLSKGVGSSSVLDLTESNNTGKIVRIMQPSDQAKQTPTVYFDNGAGLYMRSWITVSGTTNGLAGDGYNIVPPSNDPYMFGVWADVGTGIQVRTANITGAYNYSNLDRRGNYTMSIEEDGSLKWGASTRTGMDVGVSRDGPGLIEVNQGSRGQLGDLKLRNLIASGTIQFSSASTGTGIANLGANSPAAAPAQPLTWIGVNLPDGSHGWIPVWK